MDTSEYYASPWLHAEDIHPTRDTVVTIEDVTAEELRADDDGDEDDEGTRKQPKIKIALHFAEYPHRMLGLNKTNWRTVCRLFDSTEADDWLGHRISLWVNPDVEYRGETVEAIRIRARLPKTVKAKPKTAAGKSAKGGKSAKQTKKRTTRAARSRD